MLKIGQNLKYDIQVLRRHGIDMRPIDDTLLMSYALDTGVGPHGMDELSQRHLGHKPIAYKEVCGSGKSQVTFDRVRSPRRPNMPPRMPTSRLRLWHILRPRLAAEGCRRSMSGWSVRWSLCWPKWNAPASRSIPALLRRLSGELTKSLAAIETEIYELAGETVQCRLDQAARGDPVRQARLSRRQEDRQRRLEHRRHRARRSGQQRKPDRGGAAPAAQAAGMAPAFEAEKHLYRHAARLYPSEDRPRAYLLRAGRPPRPDGSPPPIRTCRTSRSARRRAGRSAPPSSPSRATS